MSAFEWKDHDDDKGALYVGEEMYDEAGMDSTYTQPDTVALVELSLSDDSQEVQVFLSRDQAKQIIRKLMNVVNVPV